MTEQTQAYCVKCREKREIANPTAVYTKTGRPGISGQCPVCGTTLFRMGATEAHENIAKPEVIEKPTAKKPAAKAKSRKTARGKKKTVAKKSTPSTSESSSSRRRKGNKLVIVESPAKARSVGRFLGNGYVVKASKGHVRDLLVTQ